MIRRSFKNGRYRELTDPYRLDSYYEFVIAEDCMTGEQVSIRKFDIHNMYQRADLTRDNVKFIRDSEIIKNLNDKNLLRITDVFMEDNSCYDVIEFPSGQTLEALFEKRGPFPQAEADRILGDILNGLKLLHENTVIHSNVTPQTIWIREDGTVSLFHNTSAVYQRPAPAGYYLNDRQLAFYPCELIYGNGRHNESADLYEAAAVYYWMLTGTVSSLKEKSDIAPLHTITGVSRRIGTAVQQTLFNDPSKRPQSVDDFRELLENKGMFAFMRKRSAISEKDPAGSSEPEEDPVKTIEKICRKMNRKDLQALFRGGVPEACIILLELSRIVPEDGAVSPEQKMELCRDIYRDVWISTRMGLDEDDIKQAISYKYAAADEVLEKIIRMSRQMIIEREPGLSSLKKTDRTLYG